MNAEVAEIDREQTPAWWRHFVPGWFTLIAFGFLLYELTAWPALGILVACAKFGFADWRAAIWLARRDPRRGRAWASFWLYVAAGLWKTAIMAVVVFFVVVVAVEITWRLGNPGQARRVVVLRARAELQGAVTVAVLAFGMTVFTAALALASAAAFRVRLWLNPAIADAARRGTWPPEPTGRTNHAGWLLWTLLGLALAVLLVVVGALALPLLRRFGRVGAGVLGVCVFGGVAVLLAWRKSLAERLLAHSPEDCWGPPAYDEVVGTGLSEGGP